MRSMTIAAAALALAGCAAVSTVPEKADTGTDGNKQVQLRVTANGSALFYDAETLIDRALEAAEYACCRMKATNLKKPTKCPPELQPPAPNTPVKLGLNTRAKLADGSMVTLNAGTIVTVDAGAPVPQPTSNLVGDFDNAQKIAESVKAAIDVFGAHSFALKVSCP